MLTEGAEKKIDVEIYHEAEAIVQYKRFVEFLSERLNVLKNLSRKEYRINLDDRRLNLTQRIKLKLVTMDKNDAQIEGTLIEKETEQISRLVESELTLKNIEPGQKSKRFFHLEDKGLGKVITCKGFSVVTEEKNGVKKIRLMPNAQDINLSPPPPPPEPSKRIFKKVFNPPRSSTQDHMISPIKPSVTPTNTVNLNSLALDESFNLLSVSPDVPREIEQTTQESSVIESIHQRMSATESYIFQADIFFQNPNRPTFHR